MSDNNNNVSKVDKYKKRKKTEIIVFPKINNKKNKINHSPINSKDVDELLRNY